MPCKRKEGTNMITNIDELAQNEAVAYLKADPNHFDWWMQILVGKTPDSAEGLQDRISR